VRIVDSLVALFIRAKRRYDIRCRVHDRGLLFSLRVARVRRHRRDMSGCTGSWSVSWYQGRWGGLRTAAAASGGRGDLVSAVASSHQDRPGLDGFTGTSRYWRLLVRL